MKQLPIIIAIVGASGSGKTLASHLLHKKHGIPFLVSFTTRPMRQNEIDGIDHWFVGVEGLPPSEERLAYTFFGNHHYWTSYKQLEGHPICSYVIDEDGLRMLLRHQGKRWKVVSVLICREAGLMCEQVDVERRARDKHRQTINNYQYDEVICNNRTPEDLVTALSEAISRHVAININTI